MLLVAKHFSEYLQLNNNCLYISAHTLLLDIHANHLSV